MEPIGLLAGWGRLPVLIAEAAQRAGIPIVSVGIRGMADGDALAKASHRFYWNRPAALGGYIRKMKRAGCKRWMSAGKVHKVQMFSAYRWVYLLPDLRMVRFWFRRRRNNADDSLILGIIDEFARDGLEYVSPLELVPELLVKPGVLTKRKPSSRESADIEYGWQLAKEMGRLDIGQSVAVRDLVVLAVEAIEGTDEAIKRAGTLCKTGGFVVVKVAKPTQDMRFDVPTIGPQTIATMKAAGAVLLAVEAGKTILVDEAETIRCADSAGITLVALDNPSAGTNAQA